MSEDLTNSHLGIHAALELHMELNEGHRFSSWLLPYETDEAFLVQRDDDGNATAYWVGATCTCGETWGKPGYPWGRIELEDGGPLIDVPQSVFDDMQARLNAARGSVHNMLYYLRPAAPLVWADVDWRMAKTAATEHGADLARLDWNTDTDQVLDDFKVRVALRHGVACAGGIVVEGLMLRAGGEGDRLRSISYAAQQSQEDLRAHDEVLENLMPGWKASGEALDQQIAQHSEATAQRRDARAGALLDVKPDPQLVAHWERVGGTLPDPI